MNPDEIGKHIIFFYLRVRILYYLFAHSLFIKHFLSLIAMHFIFFLYNYRCQPHAINSSELIVMYWLQLCHLNEGFHHSSAKEKREIRIIIGAS